MNRIKKTFNKLSKDKRKAFIVYITAGYPSMAATEKIVLELERSGVDIVELGVPFSDPMADGLTIQRSSERSLKSGTTLHKILKSVKKIRGKSQIPIILMSYLNPVYHYGVEKFVRDAVKCGVDGAIFPDLPAEEAAELEGAARAQDLYLIFLASPTSTNDRLKIIARHSKGFIYYVSLTGVTGARAALPSHISKNIKRIKRLTDKPVCVGFGVSNEKQARDISRVADGVIIGSALIRVIGENEGKSTLNKAVGKFTSSIAKAVHNE
ncbi:MAG: tryptophan synthase subunit alpha [Candidatus Omnitrophica bacterium]|nr:tryptophan synthase subunit alpha [Candidatus Omnitrophota bacterium]